MAAEVRDDAPAARQDAVDAVRQDRQQDEAQRQLGIGEARRLDRAQPEQQGQTGREAWNQATPTRVEVLQQRSRTSWIYRPPAREDPRSARPISCRTPKIGQSIAQGCTLAGPDRASRGRATAPNGGLTRRARASDTPGLCSYTSFGTPSRSATSAARARSTATSPLSAAPRRRRSPSS